MLHTMVTRGNIWRPWLEYDVKAFRKEFSDHLLDNSRFWGWLTWCWSHAKQKNSETWIYIYPLEVGIFGGKQESGDQVSKLSWRIHQSQCFENQNDYKTKGSTQMPRSAKTTTKVTKDSSMKHRSTSNSYQKWSALASVDQASRVVKIHPIDEQE